MTIKMSDVFDLPTKKTPGGMMPYLKDCNGGIIFVGDQSHVRAAVLAINAYDANQAEIAELKALLDLSEAKHDRLVDANTALKSQAKLMTKFIQEVSNWTGCLGDDATVLLSKIHDI